MEHQTPSISFSSMPDSRWPAFGHPALNSNLESSLWLVVSRGYLEVLTHQPWLRRIHVGTRTRGVANHHKSPNPHSVLSPRILLDPPRHAADGY